MIEWVWFEQVLLCNHTHLAPTDFSSFPNLPVQQRSSSCSLVALKGARAHAQPFISEEVIEWVWVKTLPQLCNHTHSSSHTIIMLATNLPVQQRSSSCALKGARSQQQHSKR